MSERLSRRAVLGAGATLLAASRVHAAPSGTRLARPKWKAPNEKLAIAAIGAGGKAEANLDGLDGENIVALCDVDFSRAAASIKKFPRAARYKDFRELLDKERGLDAVVITTPDHSHAAAAVWAMQRGLHVYLEKPLAHSIFEVRRLLEISRRAGVATQMGNSGHSSERTRRLCEIIWRGDIGPVRQVHVWTNRPIWPQGLDGPLPAATPPADLDWDLWLGPAPVRAYNPGYAPFKWRGWYDFGCGALGDMGCHHLDPANWALQLGQPTSVMCTRQEGGTAQTFPKRSTVRYDFPERPTMPAVAVTWYDGGLLPPRPERMRADLAFADNGALFIGDRGILGFGIEDRAGGADGKPSDAGAPPPRPAAASEKGGFMVPGTLPTGGNVRGTSGALFLMRDDLAKDYTAPEPMLTRAPNHHQDFIRACKGGDRPGSNFEVAAPFTEWVLLGTIAQRYPGQSLTWDSKAMRISNFPEANRHLRRTPRRGWEI